MKKISIVSIILISLAVFFSISNIAHGDITSGLVGHWTMDSADIVNQNPATIQPTGVSSEITDDSSYNAFPGLSFLPNGNLIAIYTGHATQHVVTFPEGNLYYKISTNNGSTWGSEISLSQTRLGSGDPEITLLSSGKLIVSFTVDSWNSSIVHTNVIIGTPAQDNTITWGSPIEITSTFDSGTSYTASKVIELSNGNLILPITGYYSGSSAINAEIVSSTDQGATWGNPVMIGVGTFNEANGVQLSTGRIIMLVRQESTTLANSGYARVYSDDNGLTWSSPVRVMGPAKPGRPTILRISDNELFFAGRYTYPDYQDSYAVSYDQGLTWKSLGLMSPNKPNMYNSAVLLSDGSIGLAYAFETSSSTSKVVYQQFASPGTAVSDSSGNENQAQYLGNFSSSIETAGQLSGALSFDGSHGKFLNVQENTGLQISGDITACAWIKVSGTDSNFFISKYLGASDAGWFLYVTGGNLYLAGRDKSGSYHSSTNATLPVNDNIWHLTCGQRSGSIWQTYVDGEYNGGKDMGMTGNMNATGVPITIGGYFNGYNSFSPFTGSIDDVRIYSRALSSSDMMALYVQGTAPVDGGWSDWSEKNNSCGISGTQTRTCTNPVPANGEADCSLLDGGNSSQSYTNDACPVHQSSGGSSVSSRFNNLVAMGNSQAAENLKKEFPNQFSNNQIPIVPSTSITPAVTSTPSVPFTPIVLSRIIKLSNTRMWGDDVLALQTLLTAKGYDVGTPDGNFGPKTQAGVIAFQKANGLTLDGFVGTNTLKYLNGNQTTTKTTTSPTPIQPAVTRILKLSTPRMIGDDVKVLQTYLSTNGYDVGALDGVLGTKTKSAIIAFQTANGLTPDGLVGAKTREVMK